MKYSLRLLVVAGAIFSPMIAIAQSAQQGLTREQVRNEMIQYEAAGFNPAHANPRTWVSDLQAATTKVMVARNAESQSQLAESGASKMCN